MCTVSFFWLEFYCLRGIMTLLVTVLIWTWAQLCKTFFSTTLLSCLHIQLFSLSKTSILYAISKEKQFKPLCWIVNENSDVDVAFNRACYNCKEQKNKYFSGFIRSYLVSLTFGYLWNSSSTTWAANSEKKNIRVEFAGFTDQRNFAHSRTHKERSLKSPNFNLRVKRREKFLNHEADISKTDPVILLSQGKILFNNKSEMHVWKIVQKNYGVEFLQLGTELFSYFPCFFFYG